MKVTEAKGGRNERLILTGVITSSAVCGAVAQVWDGKLFSARWSNIIAGWCVAHYRKFRKPPGKKIQSLFDRWADANPKDRDTTELVSAFLADLSRAYAGRKKEVDPEYTIDLAKEYFERVKLENLREEIGGLVQDGDVKEALRRVTNLRPVEIGLESWSNPFTDLSAVKSAFEEMSDPMITFPPDTGLRAFFGDSLEREGFVVIFAPEKRGKSQFLLDLAWRGMEQGRRVAMFQLGDLSKKQFYRRWYARAAGRPNRATLPGRHVLVPEFMGPPSVEGGLPDIRHAEKRWEEDMPFALAQKKAGAILKRLGGADGFRLSVHPARTLTIDRAGEILDRWERQDGWVADVVVFDYAELFAPLDGKAETRDQINATWIGMASLRLRRRCLVVTATQTDAASFETELLTMSNFSEDKRKFSHVSGGFGLNQSAQEKALGVYRLNWLVGRDWEYDSNKCLYVAGCAATQNPMMFSTF